MIATRIEIENRDNAQQCSLHTLAANATLVAKNSPAPPAGEKVTGSAQAA